MSAMTNNAIIEMYKAEKGINMPLHTYARWKSMGYQVKHGEKSNHRFMIWKNCTKKHTDEKTGVETISNRLIMQNAYFFTAEQVERIKN